MSPETESQGSFAPPESAAGFALELLGMLGSVTEEERAEGAMLLEAEIEQHQKDIQLLIDVATEATELRDASYEWRPPLGAPEPSMEMAGGDMEEGDCASSDCQCQIVK